MYLRMSLVFLVAFLSACGGGSSSSTPNPVPNPALNPAPDPTITQFTLVPANNTGIDAEINFSLDDNYEFSGRISTNTEVSKLKASFEFTGTSVSIGDVAQESGTTENDFTNKLTYTVANEDGDTQDYVVDLTKFTGLPIVYLKTDDAAAIE